MTITQALISVSDKTGIIELALGLTKLNVSIISSGGTSKALTGKGVKCREIADVTGSPEILDGRVKTLHPKIHGGILARRDDPSHLEELAKHGIGAIDLVVVNLYPFEATLNKLLSDEITDEVVENIDIGGVALLRAAAKNFAGVIVVCDPADYLPVLERIKANTVDAAMRQELAAKAFRHTAYYDALIAGFFSREKFPEKLTLPFKKLSGLRYGENPHQEAAVYTDGKETKMPAAVTARQLQGKELSYNNYLDLESAWKLVQEFENPACSIIKHNNPCGCAESTDIFEAYKKALACDPASAFGGIIAFNRKVDEATAGEAVKLFTECVIAPAYTDKALEIFAAKKNLRVLIQPVTAPAAKPGLEREYRTLTGGMLAQDRDNALLNETKTATQRTPTKEERESLLFAWKICKHVKSNAIILVRGTQAVGIGAGQMSRIDSLKIATEKMKAVALDQGSEKYPLVLASDAFFPFPDVVNLSAEIGVKAIIQPGGSIKDADSIQAADANSIAMIFTAMRHFRH